MHEIRVSARLQRVFLLGGPGRHRRALARVLALGVIALVRPAFGQGAPPPSSADDPWQAPTVTAASPSAPTLPLPNDADAVPPGSSPWETRPDILCGPYTSRLGPLSQQVRTEFDDFSLRAEDCAPPNAMRTYQPTAQARAQCLAAQANLRQHTEERDRLAMLARRCNQAANARRATRERSAGSAPIEALQAIPEGERTATEARRVAGAEAAAQVLREAAEREAAEAPLREEGARLWAERYATIVAERERARAARARPAPARPGASGRATSRGRTRPPAEPPAGVSSDVAIATSERCVGEHCWTTDDFPIAITTVTDPAAATCDVYQDEARQLVARFRELSPDWAPPAAEGSDRFTELATIRHRLGVVRFEHAACVDAMWTEYTEALRASGDRCARWRAALARTQVAQPGQFIPGIGRVNTSREEQIAGALLQRCTEALAIISDDAELGRTVDALETQLRAAPARPPGVWQQF